MLEYVLLMEDCKEIIYAYYPGGDSDKGIISYSKESGEITIQKLSEKDQHRIYALKKCKRIREFTKEGVFQKSGYIAWY